MGPNPLGREGGWSYATRVLTYQSRSFYTNSFERNNYADLPENVDPVTPWHSRSLKVIGTDTDRSATDDFLLVFRIVTMGLCRIVFEIKGNICKIFTPSYIYRSRWAVPLGFFNGGRAQKIIMMPLPYNEKMWRYVPSFRHSTLPVLNGRTDEQTDGQNR